MTTMRISRLGGAAAVALLTGGTLAACGGAASSGTSPSGTSAATSAGQGPQNGSEGGDGSQFAAIQKCLAAAGISVPTPPPAPSGAPTGAPTGGPGGPGSPFSDAKVIAALKACGINVPTGAPGAGPGPAPTTTNRSTTN